MPQEAACSIARTMKPVWMVVSGNSSRAWSHEHVNMAKAQEGDKMVELTLLPSGPIPPAAFDNAFGYGMMQTPEEVNEVLREVYLRGRRSKELHNKARRF